MASPSDAQWFRYLDHGDGDRQDDDEDSCDGCFQPKSWCDCEDDE